MVSQEEVGAGRTLVASLFRFAVRVMNKGPLTLNTAPCCEKCAPGFPDPASTLSHVIDCCTVLFSFALPVIGPLSVSPPGH